MRLSERRFRQGAELDCQNRRDQDRERRFQTSGEFRFINDTMWPGVGPTSAQIVALVAFDGAEQFVNADDVKSRYRRDVRICRQSFYSAGPAVHPIAVAAFAHWRCLRSALMAQEPLLPGSAYSWLFPRTG